MSEPVEDRQTARLRLRRPVMTDVNWLTALHGDPRNYPHSPGGAHTPERARELAEMTARDWAADEIGYWIVEHADEPVGLLGLKRMMLAERPAWNLYYRFTATARGQGFATEAGQEALVVAAAVDPRRPVVVRTRPANEPARRLAVTLGLTRRSELDADDGFVIYASGW